MPINNLTTRAEEDWAELSGEGGEGVLAMFGGPDHEAAMVPLVRVETTRVETARRAEAVAPEAAPTEAGLVLGEARAALEAVSAARDAMNELRWAALHVAKNHPVRLRDGKRRARERALAAGGDKIDADLTRAGIEARKAFEVLAGAGRQGLTDLTALPEGTRRKSAPARLMLKAADSTDVDAVRGAAAALVAAAKAGDLKGFNAVEPFAALDKANKAWFAALAELSQAGRAGKF